MVKKEKKNIKWYIISLFVVLFICAIHIFFILPINNIPTENTYLEAKENYQEKSVTKKEIPIADITNIPPDCEIYSQQISRYYLPLAESWDKAACDEYGLSNALQNCYGEEPLQDVGFVCMDINNDGTKELLIGSLAPSNPVILELWAVVNEKPKMIAQAEEQSRYYLRFNQSENSYIWENCNGPVENETAYFFFEFNGSYMEYLWHIFPGVTGDIKYAAEKMAAKKACGERILAELTPYAALTQA